VRTAHIVASDDEAIEVAKRLSHDFASGASARDAHRQLPVLEIDQLSESGLLGITVPPTYGGAGVSISTLTEVFRLLAIGDPNIAQIPQNHMAFLNGLDLVGTPEQKALFFGEVLRGKRLGNAAAEAGSRTAKDVRTRLVPVSGGLYCISGIKNYCTGALFADWIPVLAQGEDGLCVAYVPVDAPGVQVLDDWDGLGQRTTASGTVVLEEVLVAPSHVLPHYRIFEGPQVDGAIAQILHAAIDVGIAGSAFADAVGFVREKSRPWHEAGVERASDDALVIQRFGELAIELRASEALLREAAEAIDRARSTLTDASAAQASIAVAAAKAHATRASVSISSALFELCGTRSSLQSLNLDRHWRNARTHTLHDPVLWKLQHIGRYVLNGTFPPRNGQI
jgi:SfnB family sulfur acquisition oxidoreductase